MAKTPLKSFTNAASDIGGEVKLAGFVRLGWVEALTKALKKICLSCRRSGQFLNQPQ